jgi:hypothetical protein
MKYVLRVKVGEASYHIHSAPPNSVILSLKKRAVFFSSLMVWDKLVRETRLRQIPARYRLGVDLA